MGLFAAGYSIYSYRQSRVDTEGIVICQADICEKSLHIHASITVSICGKPVDLSDHTGDTNEQHTHAEDNLIHFHQRLKVDPQTKAILDPSPLYLKNLFQNLNLTFPSLCPNGKPGKLKVIVNGQESPLLDQYPWADGDVIKVTYD